MQALSASFTQTLTAASLARLCMASVNLRHAAAGLVRGAARQQHGLKLEDGDLSVQRLRVLEATPRRCALDLRRHLCTVEAGSSFERVAVGGIDHAEFRTRSQMPPAAGDTWSCKLALQTGDYALVAQGWRNPSHAILDLFLSGVRITPAEGLDWCGPRTQKQTHHVRRVRVQYTGEHTLRARIGLTVPTQISIDTRASGCACAALRSKWRRAHTSRGFDRSLYSLCLQKKMGICMYAAVHHTHPAA